MTAHAAFLRVYEPLAAFQGDERARWAACAAGEAVAPAAGAALEREASLRALLARPAVSGSPPTGTLSTVLPVVAEQAYVLEVDGVTLVCPWRTRLRALEGLEELAADLTGQMARAFLLPSAEAASLELARWREEHPGLRSHQLTSTWQVPLRWFVLVDADEREVRTGPGGLRSLVYRTPMSRARRRVARALAVLRRTVDDGGVTGGVEDLGRWLEEFHPRSLLELDYGGLVDLLDDAELGQDESARDIAGALTALGAGEPVQAAAAYSRVTARMKALQAVETAN